MYHLVKIIKSYSCNIFVYLTNLTNFEFLLLYTPSTKWQPPILLIVLQLLLSVLLMCKEYNLSVEKRKIMYTPLAQYHNLVIILTFPGPPGNSFDEWTKILVWLINCDAKQEQCAGTSFLKTGIIYISYEDVLSLQPGLNWGEDKSIIIAPYFTGLSMLSFWNIKWSASLKLGSFKVCQSTLTCNNLWFVGNGVLKDFSVVGFCFIIGFVSYSWACITISWFFLVCTWWFPFAFSWFIWASVINKSLFFGQFFFIRN